MFFNGLVYLLRILIAFFLFKSSLHDKSNLIIPNLQFIGLNIKDLEKLSIKQTNLIKLTQNDRLKANCLLKKEFIKQEIELKEQVKIFFLNFKIKYSKL